MALLDNIPYFRKQKEQLQRDIQKLEQNKTNLEKSIAILKQTNTEEQNKQEQLKTNTKQLEENINELTEKKNELDEKLKNREKMFIETELKYIDHLDGWSFEKYCSELFTKLGFTSIVTKGSSDYGGDIVATYNNEQYVVQCKRYNEPISAKPIGEVLRSMKHYKCEKGVIVTNSTFTTNAIEEAKDCDVELWDRNILINYLGIAYNFDLAKIDIVKYGINNVNDVTNALQVIDRIKQNQNTSIYSDDVIKSIENPNISYHISDDEYDPLFFDAVDVVVKTGQASTFLLQRYLKIGYARAGRLMDTLTLGGIISGYEGNKPRKILLSKDVWENERKKYSHRLHNIV